MRQSGAIRRERMHRMKKVWMGLCAVCLGIGILGTVSDIASGSFTEDTALVLFMMVLLAAIFGYLAWVWRLKSPVKRAGQQAAAVAAAAKKNARANRELSKPLKSRMWRHRVIGLLVAAAGIWMWQAGGWHEIAIIAGTIVLIAGIAIIMLGSPTDYNSSTDIVKMIAMDKRRTIEEFYEAYKNMKTPLGSAWLGKFYTSAYKTLVFGPDERGQFIYFWLNKRGEVGYVGYSFLKGLIKKKLTEPLIPAQTDLGENTAGHLCYHTDVFFFQEWLKESIQSYLKTGEALPFRETQASEVYTFTESFKLTGQHFDVQDKDGKIVYEVDGTFPLINLYIRDTQGNEIFRMTKEIGHALATYRFFYRGEPYGVLEKQFTFIRDKFAMDMKDGRLELIEYAGTIGHNFKVLLNGKMIGAVMDNMDITVGNVFFDNSFLIVYDEKYLPLLTAMAVMVTRELARDEDGGLTNRTGGVTDII